MTATTCKLCFAPISTCACVTDEHLAARFAAMRQPPLREFLGARERIRVRQFPDVVAGEQTEWSALAIEAIGDTPAARAATHLDHQRWVRQQLSLRTDDTAPARAVSMGVVKTDREFAALAKTATRLGLAVSQGAGTADRELRAMVDEVRGRIFGTPATLRDPGGELLWGVYRFGVVDEQSSASARIFNLAGELLLWREVCGDLVAADDEARRTWLTKQVRLAEVYRHNLEAVASMLAEGRAYGGGPDDAVGYLAEVLRSAREPWHNTPTCPRCTGPLVAYDHDDESPTPPGLLRCTACGRYAEATAEQRAQAEAADAAWRKHQGGGSDAG